VFLKAVWILVILIVAAGLWIRFAPTDSGKWHKALPNPANKDFAAGVIRVLPNRAENFGALHAAALGTDRTILLAGSVEEGIATYVTRTFFWGFPDYATAWIEGDSLVIYSRLRFGTGDHGVNRAKVEKWIAALPNP